MKIKKQNICEHCKFHYVKKQRNKMINDRFCCVSCSLNYLHDKIAKEVN